MNNESLVTYFVVRGIIELTRPRKVSEVEALTINPHVLIDVVRLNFIHEGICVCEEQVSFLSIQLLDEIVMKVEHVQFGKLEHTESHIERLVDLYFDLPHVDAYETLAENFESETMRLGDLSFGLFLVNEKLDICPLFEIFAGLPVYSVVHELEKVFLKLILCSGAKVLVLLDVRASQRDCLKELTR